MGKEERIGKTCVAEIIPHCHQCGELLDIPYRRARELTQHEQVDVKCEHCGTVSELETELCFFDRRRPKPEQASGAVATKTQESS